MSFIAWIDFDQADRDRTRRIMDLFGNEESRDELGLGAIRDALADLMFPGTSTIQTRLRYMMFVPWIYQIAGREKGTASSRRDLARALEIRLIDALDRGGEKNGVIGSDARERLKRLPSDVYWAGLLALGIRQFQGSRSACLEAGPGDASRLWSPGLPVAPEGFLTDPAFQAHFALTSAEADFMRDRLVHEAPGSLFTLLSRAQNDAECDFIWLHPARADWRGEIQSLVLHAERFSRLMLGASLLYNLMLSEKAASRQGAEHGEWSDRVEFYLARLNDWAEDTPPETFEDWSLPELWDVIRTTPHAVKPQTCRFIEDWRNTVRACSGKVSSDDVARQLVQERESRLKGPKSRFRNDGALARWRGASGATQMSFRWQIVSSHLKDLQHAK